MKFTKKVSKPISVTTFLLQGMSGYDEHRGTDIIHASDLTDNTPKNAFCPREYALLNLLGKPKKGTPINASMQYTYDMGRDIEARIQNDYLGDVAVGHWRCQSCGNTRNWCKRPKNGCEREDITCRWKYDEVRVKHDGMIGGFDLCVDLGRPKLRLIEIKSIIKEDYEKLKAPLAEHRVRTILYLHLIRNSTYADEVDTERATIIYASKSYGKWSSEQSNFSPFKEYEIRYDYATIVNYVNQAAVFGKYLSTGEMPNGVCSTSTCTRAKACRVTQECFSGQYKPGQVVA